MYISFINLEKYEIVGRKELWRVLDSCDVKKYFIMSVNSLYERSTEYVK